MSDTFNLAEFCLQENLEKRGNKEALIFLRGKNIRASFTYRELAIKMASLSKQLKEYNLQKGSRIFIRLNHSPEFAIAFFAIVASGYVAVPASPQLSKEEVTYLLKDSASSLVLFDSSLPLPSEIPSYCISLDIQKVDFEKESNLVFFNTRKDDPAFLVYTSGTTAYPKGVLHAQRSVLGRIPMLEGWTGLQEKDRLLHAGQMNWTYTLGVGLMDTWASGATSILYSGESIPEYWPYFIGREQVSIFVAVPALYRRILKYTKLYNYNLQSLRHCLCAGEALTSDLHEVWVRESGKELFEALGMSEVSTYISSSSNFPYRSGSPGKPQKGRKVCLLPIDKESTEPLEKGEEGYIAIHKTEPGLMLGYWNVEDKKHTGFRGDWFITGDVAHYDEDGYYYYHGRNDEMMNSFGYRVSPLEVERVLKQCLLVSDAAVTEIKKENGISLIAAFVVLQDSCNETQVAEKILQYCSERLARYKTPREFHFVNKLPRNSNGKLKRKDLLLFL
ncbi:MAG: acyl-CoA synthetase [Leptospiraceae bacterium]|nr:acyl-CoA synthetase [Leptospiraceae bacterium]